MSTNHRNAETASDRPWRIRLPGFVKSDDVGLGDVVKRVTHAVGIKPCAACERRAATLNRWVRFSKGGPR